MVEFSYLPGNNAHLIFFFVFTGRIIQGRKTIHMKRILTGILAALITTATLIIPFSSTAASPTEMSVVYADGTAGQILVEFKNVPIGVTVMVYSWTQANGQDDNFMQCAAPMADGTYKAVIDVNDHNYEFGTYTIQGFINYPDGTSVPVNSIDATITPLNYIYASNSGNGTASIGVINPSVTPDGDITLFFWSEKDGQDDLTTASAKMVAPGQYATSVQIGNLGYMGSCRVLNVHAYATVNGVSEYLGGISTGLESPEINAHVQGLTSATNYLVAVSIKEHRIGVYQWTGCSWDCIMTDLCSTGASNATPRGTFRIGGKGYSFGTPEYTCYYYSSFKGSEYLFHSVLYYPGTKKIKSGRLGRSLSHGCVRLDIDDAKYIQDVVPAGTAVYIY